MFDDQRWRDSYDAWKLATPPEYEVEEDPTRCPCCRDSIVDPTRNYASPGSDVCSNCDGNGYLEDDGTEPCPGCSVEWAEMLPSNCDICNGKRRVPRYDGPSEAEIDRSQALIGAILGIDEEEIAF